VHGLGSCSNFAQVNLPICEPRAFHCARKGPQMQTSKPISAAEALASSIQEAKRTFGKTQTTWKEIQFQVDDGASRLEALLQLSRRIDSIRRKHGAYE
jgi:hypothetical protein